LNIESVCVSSSKPGLILVSRPFAGRSSGGSRLGHANRLAGRVDQQRMKVGALSRLWTIHDLVGAEPGGIFRLVELLVLADPRALATTAGAFFGQGGREPGRDHRRQRSGGGTAEASLSPQPISAVTVPTRFCCSSSTARQRGREEISDLSGSLGVAPAGSMLVTSSPCAVGDRGLDALRVGGRHACSRRRCSAWPRRVGRQAAQVRVVARASIRAILR
jgi:hypothetical protein